MKYKIFILTGHFEIGGTERYLDILISNLNKSKYTPTIGCFRNQGPFAPKIDNAPVVFPFRGLLKLPVDILILVKLIKFLCREKFDLIYSTHFQTNIYLSIANLFCNNSVFISGYRGLNPDKGKISVIFDSVVTKLSDVIIVNSKASRCVLINRTKIKRKKIQIIYNGLEKKRCLEDTIKEELKTIDKLKKICGTKIVLGTVGRLHKLKGHEYLIQAFKILSQKHRNLHLLIVGDGRERIRLEKLAIDLNIPDKISFTGFIHDTDSILNIFDIFVLPSVSESFPNSLLEAMNQGIPCVATNVGGVHEIIEHKVTGMLAESRSKTSIAYNISALIEDDRLKTRIAKKGKETASLFTTERMVHQVEKTFEQALLRNSTIFRGNG